MHGRTDASFALSTITRYRHAHSGIEAEGFHAGIVEGFVEALYHDLASLVVAGVPMEIVTDTIDEIREATVTALADLSEGLQGEGDNE